jgi:hypothetical protein
VSMTTNRKEAAQQAARALTDFANWASTEEFEEFTNELTKSHRTLQQSTFRLMVDCIKAWSDCYDEEWFDLRNEDTVRTSKHLWENHLKHQGIRYV